MPTLALHLPTMDEGMDGRIDGISITFPLFLPAFASLFGRSQVVPTSVSSHKEGQRSRKDEAAVSGGGGDGGDIAHIHRAFVSDLSFPLGHSSLRSFMRRTEERR